MENDKKTGFLQDINQGFEEKATQKKALELGLGYVNLEKFTPNIDFLSLISKKEALLSETFPLDINGKNVRIALVNPENKETQKIIENLKAHFEVSLFLCSHHAWKEKIKWYDSELLQKKKIQENSTIIQDQNEFKNFKEAIQNYGESKEKINTLPSQNAFQEIKTMALRLNASDIHIQPFKKHALLRFRVDGVLYDIFEIPIEQAHKIILRIKYESGMKSNIVTLPQDGHIDFEYQNRRINFRVSSIPTPFFESLVIRVLDSQKGFMTLESLGFSKRDRQLMKEQYQRNQGMVLITGPTGSGKTTSLYAVLSELNTSEKKIVTLEDPIEYRFEGISQSQINPKEGYTFETGFESVLRHDPDIILVGEIRNQKTARLACESSMTGHLVLSSLHTNSSIESIARLRNLGIENFNIAPAINIIIAQRLVRKIHPERAQEPPIPQDPLIQKAIQRNRSIFPDQSIPKTVLRPVVKSSYESPYQGRMAVGEILVVDDVLRNMIIGEKSTLEIKNYVTQETKFLSLFENGVLKVLQGKTTFEEVYRVLS